MIFSTIATVVQGCVWSLKMLAWISTEICIQLCWLCLFSKAFLVFNFVVVLHGFCLFGVHVILLVSGAAAYPSHCLCLQPPCSSGKYSLAPWGNLVLLKNCRAFGSGPTNPFIQIPNSTRSETLHSINWTITQERIGGTFLVLETEMQVLLPMWH